MKLLFQIIKTVKESKMKKACIELSIIIPVACYEDQLKLVVDRLIKTNINFFNRYKIEIILIDTFDNPFLSKKIKRYIKKIENLISAPNIKYVISDRDGGAAKIIYGVKKAKGEFIFIMTDTTISMYSFLEDLYIISKRKNLIANAPYYIPQIDKNDPIKKFYRENNILGYYRQIPFICINFCIIKKDHVLKIYDPDVRHGLGLHFWAVNIWRKNIIPIYYQKHLEHIPICLIDIERPKKYSDGKKISPDFDRYNFAKKNSEKNIYENFLKMKKKIKNFNSKNNKKISVITSIKGGVFLIYKDKNTNLNYNYKEVTSNFEIEKILNKSYMKWKTEGLPILKNYLRVYSKNQKKSEKIKKLIYSVISKIRLS